MIDEKKQKREEEDLKKKKEKGVSRLEKKRLDRTGIGIEKRRGTGRANSELDSKEISVL